MYFRVLRLEILECFVGGEASTIGFVLCVRGVMPTEKGGLGSHVVFVDGGNSFNPYLAAEVAVALVWTRVMF
ncbi:MAG: hypothetical protein ACP5JW_05045 [Candidatus Bathyarchaeia archaeon]